MGRGWRIPGRIRPTSVEVGPTSVEIGPNLVCPRPNTLGTSRPMSPGFGPTSPKPTLTPFSATSRDGAHTLGRSARNHTIVARSARALSDPPPVTRPLQLRARARSKSSADGRPMRRGLSRNRSGPPASIASVATASADNSCASLLSTSAAVAVVRHCGGPGPKRPKRAVTNPPPWLTADTKTRQGGKFRVQDQGCGSE